MSWDKAKSDTETMLEPLTSNKNPLSDLGQVGGNTDSSISGWDNAGDKMSQSNEVMGDVTMDKYQASAYLYIALRELKIPEEDINKIIAKTQETMKDIRPDDVYAKAIDARQKLQEM